MRALIIILLVQLFAITSSCTNQSKKRKSDSYKLDRTLTRNDPVIAEDIKVVKEALGIESFTYALSPNLRASACSIRIRKFRQNQLVADWYIPKRFSFPATLALYTRIIGDSAALFFDYEQSSVVTTFKASYPDEKYSWMRIDKFDTDSIVKPQLDYPVLAFGTTPRDANNPDYCIPCMLPDYANSYQSWYKRFGMKEYSVVLLRFD